MAFLAKYDANNVKCIRKMSETSFLIYSNP